MSSFDPWWTVGDTSGEFVPLNGQGLERPAARVKPLACTLGSGDHREAEEGERGERNTEIEAAFAKGVEEGRRQAEQERADLARQLEGALAQIGGFVASIERRYSETLLDVAFAVAEKIVCAELKERPEQWLAMIREGIRQAVDREAVRIRVAQPLYGFLLSKLDGLRKMVEEAKTIDLVEDAGVGESGCIIETRYGDIDVGLKTQLEAARTVLLSEEQGT